MKIDPKEITKVFEEMDALKNALEKSPEVRAAAQQLREVMMEFGKPKV